MHFHSGTCCTRWLRASPSIHEIIRTSFHFFFFFVTKNNVQSQFPKKKTSAAGGHVHGRAASPASQHFVPLHTIFFSFLLGVQRIYSFCLIKTMAQATLLSCKYAHFAKRQLRPKASALHTERCKNYCVLGY